MKGLEFDRKFIRTIFERMGRFRPKHRLFMSWRKFVPLCLNYFSRGLLLTFTILFLGIFFENLFSPKSTFLKTKEKIISNNKDYLAHYLLAQQLFETNNYDLAKQQFLLANEKIPPALDQPEKIQEEIVYWQKLVEEVPNYRDAFLKLFSLSKNIYQDFNANNYLQKAKEIDPNNEIIQKLSRP